MRKFARGVAPEFLVGKWQAWGEEWERRRAENPKASFHWHVVDGEAVNQKLLPVLKAQVQNHCSFCDSYPVSPPSVDTVEHFRPKSQFPREAYKWENLYFCCCHCQAKGEDFDEALLRPDAEDYSFDRYFRWDFTTGRLEVNERAPREDQNRAQVTVELYRLNEEHPSLRRRELRRRSKDPEAPLDDFAYRHFVSATSGAEG
jgi:uncharacterized protein (TIGR02646 family)